MSGVGKAIAVIVAALLLAGCDTPRDIDLGNGCTIYADGSALCQVVPEHPEDEATGWYFEAGTFPTK